MRRLPGETCESRSSETSALSVRKASCPVRRHHAGEGISAGQPFDRRAQASDAGFHQARSQHRLGSAPWQSPFVVAHRPTTMPLWKAALASPPPPRWWARTPRLTTCCATSRTTGPTCPRSLPTDRHRGRQSAGSPAATRACCGCPQPVPSRPRAPRWVGRLEGRWFGRTPERTLTRRVLTGVPYGQRRSASRRDRAALDDIWRQLR